MNPEDDVLKLAVSDRTFSMQSMMQGSKMRILKMSITIKTIVVRSSSKQISEVEMRVPRTMSRSCPTRTGHSPRRA